MNNALGDPQSALVLGGTSDIARATLAAMVARRLRTIVLAGRDVDALGAVAADLKALGATTVEVETFDALAPGDHAEMVGRVFDRHGDIDVALVSFGVLGDQNKAEHDNVEAARIVATNYLGAVTTCLPLARRMADQGHGTIVVLSSVAGERARRSNFVYGSSKAGLDAFAQGLGDALHGTGAAVMVVRPGFVRSKMTAGMDDVPFTTTPEAVADAVVAGLAKGAEAVYVPPVLRYVFSVIRHVPRPLFRKLPI
jgi:decaprenylphospho-beta-D-erythro-pentofuranosid-2-ulose 2-reductase